MHANELKSQVYLAMPLEDVLVEEILELLIGHVDTQLLKTGQTQETALRFSEGRALQEVDITVAQICNDQEWVARDLPVVLDDLETEDIQHSD